MDIWGLAHDNNFVYIGSERIDGLSPDGLNVQGFYIITSSGIAYAMPQYENIPNIIVLPDVDAETFKTLGKMYAGDKDGVYFQDEPIDGDVDVDTFVELGRSDIGGHYYAKDKNNLFLRNILLPFSNSGGDIASLEFVNKYFAKDKNNVYYIGGFRTEEGGIAKNWEILLKLKPSNFRIFPSYSGRYGTDGRQVYLLNKHILKADPDTFKVLGNSYAKDKKRVYYKGEAMEGADVESFTADSGYFDRGRDKNYIYVKGSVSKSVF